jgi:hypothetical protein
LIISSNKVLRPIRGFCSCIPMHITEFFRRGAEMVMCRPSLPKREAANRIQERLDCARDES